MKKLQQWFNGLTPRQQRLTLISFCFVFAFLLTLSIRYGQLTMKAGTILQPRIKTDSLKTK